MTRLIAMAALWAALAGLAKAELVLAFGQNGLVSSTLQGDAGSPMEVELYLTQTGDFNGSLDTRLNDLGLGSFEMLITIAGDGEVAFGPDPAFAFRPGLDTFASSTRLDFELEAFAVGDEDASGINDVVPVLAATGENSILLGTATVDVGSNASGQYQFAVGHITELSFSLGGSLFDTVTPTVGSAVLDFTAVPEPSAATLCLLAAPWALVRQRRKR